MIVAGVAWGAYTLRGRTSTAPVLATAGNFVRSAPLALAVSIAVLLSGAPITATSTGVTLALASGVLASGFGYLAWYAALQHLSGIRAATIQLVVPVLGAAAGIFLLGESLTVRLIVAAPLILGGVGVVLAARYRAA